MAIPTCNLNCTPKKILGLGLNMDQGDMSGCELRNNAMCNVNPG